jgi:phosphoglycerol geranylgeranyltransferase
MAIETISTAYMLIESGRVTSAEFMSGSRPIPREKSDIAVAHALAAELLGFKLVYLEAGSGAELSVPITLIDEISKNISIPIIVGGGIKSPGEASEKVQAGADILVVGNHFETKGNDSLIYEFADAIHG